MSERDPLNEELDRLRAENATLRTCAEQAERERDEAKEVFELALREKGWAKALTDAYTERDALRAEVVELGEMLNDALSFTPPSVERWKAMERVVETAKAAASNMDDMTATREMRDTFHALRDALDAFDRTEEK